MKLIIFDEIENFPYLPAYFVFLPKKWVKVVVISKTLRKGFYLRDLKVKIIVDEIKNVS